MGQVHSFIVDESELLPADIVGICSSQTLTSPGFLTIDGTYASGGIFTAPKYPVVIYIEDAGTSLWNGIITGINGNGEEVQINIMDYNIYPQPLLSVLSIEITYMPPSASTTFTVGINENAVKLVNIDSDNFTAPEVSLSSTEISGMSVYFGFFIHNEGDQFKENLQIYDPYQKYPANYGWLLAYLPYVGSTTLTSVSYFQPGTSYR